MSEKAFQRVDAVVRAQLCTACGACVAACPEQAVMMTETPAGGLVASVDEGACTECGLCTRICPGWHINEGLMPEGVDPFVGRVEAAYTGYCTDEEIRANAQSGGIATALLCHLLEADEIDGAIVTKMPEDGSLRPRCAIARTTEQIRAAQHSKYCPAAPLAALQNESADCGRLAFVGVSCQVHGLRNAQVAGFWQNVSVVTGLYCDRCLAYGQMDYLARVAGVPRQDALAFLHKDKREGGWPGNVSVTRRDGSRASCSEEARFNSKDIFTLPYCQLCFDKLNVLSDISLGDAHIIASDPAGSSAVLVRSEAGDSAVSSAVDAGVLRLTAVDPNDICRKSQRIEDRRFDWTQYTHSWQKMGRAAPEFHVSTKWRAPLDAGRASSYRKRLRWSLRFSAVPSARAARCAIRWKLLKGKLRRAFAAAIGLFRRPERE